MLQVNISLSSLVFCEDAVLLTNVEMLLEQRSLAWQTSRLAAAQPPSPFPLKLKVSLCTCKPNGV